MYPENTPHTSTFSDCQCPQECLRSSHAARPVMANKWKPATPHQGTKTLRVIHVVKSCTIVVMNGLDPHVSRWINIKKINLSKKNPICKRICVIYRHTHINSKSKNMNGDDTGFRSVILMGVEMGQDAGGALLVSVMGCFFSLSFKVETWSN